MEETVPQSTADLLERIDNEWWALQQAIDGLTDEQMNRPDAGGWSAKDNLAHLTAWMQFMLLHYLQGRPAHEAMGLDQATMERLDEDGINAVLLERNRNRPTADVVAELHRTYEQVWATLIEMDFADLMKPRFPDDPEKRPLLEWVIGNTYAHFEEHRRAIEAIAGK